MDDEAKKKKVVKKAKEGSSTPTKESKEKPSTPKIKKAAGSVVKKTAKETAGLKSPSTPKAAKSPSTKLKKDPAVKKVKEGKKDAATLKSPKTVKKVGEKTGVKTTKKKDKDETKVEMAEIKLDLNEDTDHESDTENGHEPHPFNLDEASAVKDITDATINPTDLSNVTESARVKLTKLLEDCADNVSLLLELHKDMCEYLKSKGIKYDTTQSTTGNHIGSDEHEPSHPKSPITHGGSLPEMLDRRNMRSPSLPGLSASVDTTPTANNGGDMGKVTASTDGMEMIRNLSAQEKALLRAKALQRIRNIKERMALPDGSERAATPEGPNELDSKLASMTV